MFEGRPARSAQRGRRGLDLLDVAVDFDPAPDIADDAARVDEKGAAHDAHILATVILLESPCAVRAGERLVRVAEQRERKPVLRTKALVAGRAVRTHAKHPHSE